MQMMLPIWGSKYQDQNTALICPDNNEINKIMLWNVQSLKEQNMNSVQNIQQAVTALQMNLRENSRGNWRGSQGRLPRSSLLRSYGSRGSQVDRLDHVSSG
jgi:hypothetical protein